MSKPYSVLESMEPQAYLNPDNFVTDYDGRNLHVAEQQYNTGLKYSNEARTIVINYKSVWGADMLNGGMVSSYEGIGYHAHTASLLRGFLAGPARIVVQRWRDGRMTETEIKPSTR